MSNLQAAHSGYGYQDLLIASRLVDLLLGSLNNAQVDKKLFEDDRFDDLTTTDSEGNRERTQIKYTKNDDRVLTLRTFTSEERGLRLDSVFESMLTDRLGPGSTASSALFRIVMRHQIPSDVGLTTVLRRLEAGRRPFLPTMNTTRYKFDAAALWAQRGDSTNTEYPFAFLFSGERSISFEDLAWVCQHLVIELGAPRFSGDLTAPGDAELLLLTRVRDEVGAESPPRSAAPPMSLRLLSLPFKRRAREWRS